jgi:hypothetical protein
MPFRRNHYRFCASWSDYILLRVASNASDICTRAVLTIALPSFYPSFVPSLRSSLRNSRPAFDATSEIVTWSLCEGAKIRQHDWSPQCHSLEKTLHRQLLDLEFLILHWHHAAQPNRRREIDGYRVRWLQEDRDGCHIGHELVAVSCNVS